MRSILFLSVMMERGWGVSLEIGEIARRLRANGIDVHVGAERSDASFDWLPVHKVAPTSQAVRALARSLKVDVIAAHTSPYFEILPDLTDEFETWAWENGDPTPAFFEKDGPQRQLIQNFKQECVYPRVNRVVAISDFIKHDIGWPDATVVTLAADHMPDLGVKSSSDFCLPRDRVIRVGTLMRLGKGEAQYKGNHLFLSLAEEVEKKGLPVEFHAAGRGTEEDAEQFRQRGIIPHLNLSDEEKTTYLRSLDIFVSMSLWEGFNLPVTEAQALGTFSLALDVGAHPEVCPYLLANPAEAIRYIERALKSPEWLEQASTSCYHFIRDNFSWDQTAQAVAVLLKTPKRSLPSPVKTTLYRNVKNALIPPARRIYRLIKRTFHAIGH